MNRVTLVGYIGSTPTVRTSEKNNPYVVLFLATHEPVHLQDQPDLHSNKDDIQPIKSKFSTQWHRIVVFQESLIEFARDRLRKGAKIMVEGQLKNHRCMTDKGWVTVSEVVIGRKHGYISILNLASSNPDAKKEKKTDASVQKHTEMRHDHGGLERKTLMLSSKDCRTHVLHNTRLDNPKMDIYDEEDQDSAGASHA